MGYRLQAIFLNGDDALAPEIEAAWSEARSRRVTQPFDGWAIALPMTTRDDASDQEEAPTGDDVAAEDVQTQVMRWSRRVPERKVVFIDSDCFGGTCLYSGCTFRDGKRIRKEQMAYRGAGVLRRLIEDLGVYLNADEYIAPLRRGYFD